MFARVSLEYMHCRSKSDYCLEDDGRIHFSSAVPPNKTQESPVSQELRVMMNHVSRALLTVCMVLLFGSFLQAQRRSSASRSLPAGTTISVRINENLSSETANAGDEFTGILTQPLIANGSTVFPRGATVAGQITSAKKSGR